MKIKMGLMAATFILATAVYAGGTAGNSNTGTPTAPVSKYTSNAVIPNGNNTASLNGSESQPSNSINLNSENPILSTSYSYASVTTTVSQLLKDSTDTVGLITIIPPPPPPPQTWVCGIVGWSPPQYYACPNGGYSNSAGCGLPVQTCP